MHEKIRFEYNEKIRFEWNEKIRFEFYEKIRFEWNEKNKIWIVWIFCIEMVLQLISMPGCDNKSWTTFKWPLKEA